MRFRTFLALRWLVATPEGLIFLGMIAAILLIIVEILRIGGAS